MPELTPSTRELARRIGVTETALRKAEAKGRIEREPDGQWDVEKTRRRMIETADPIRSPEELGWWKERGVVAIGLAWAGALVLVAGKSLTRYSTSDATCASESGPPWAWEKAGMSVPGLPFTTKNFQYSAFGVTFSWRKS